MWNEEKYISFYLNFYNNKHYSTFNRKSFYNDEKMDRSIKADFLYVQEIGYFRFTHIKWIVGKLLSCIKYRYIVRKGTIFVL